MRFAPKSLVAAALLSAATFGALAQTVGTTIPVGTGPRAIAINPVTNKVYVANEGSDNVTIINGATHGTTSVTVGDRPYWLAVNPETNRVYVVNFGDSNVSLIDGSGAVSGPLLVGGGGWTAINPVTDRAYMLRYGAGDEFNIIAGALYQNTSATRSYEPVSIAVNPVTNVVYIVHKTTGDVTAQDVTVDQPYPPLLCPNGTGGLKPNPAPTDPVTTPCINVPDVPMAVTVNPVTNKIYAVSTGQVSVINGIGQANPHAFTALTPPGVGTSAAVTVAVNPITNKIYAAFAAHVVVIDGATNAMTVIAAPGGPKAIGVNASTNKIYVPNANGKLMVIDGATNASTLIDIPVGAMAIAVNPITNTMYVLTPSGVTPVDGAATDVAQSSPITTTITPLAGNSSGSAGSVQLTVANTYPTTSGSGSLSNTRRVYYQIDSTDGVWLRAEGTGPYTASFSGLSSGTHTIYAFATNGLDAPSIMTDVNLNPVVGRLTSYAFNVAGSTAAAKLTDVNGDGKSDLLWRNTSSGQVYRMLMNGLAISSQGVAYTETNLQWSIVGDADFTGDGITDLLWRNSVTGDIYLQPFNSSGLPSGGTVIYREANAAWKIVATPDLDGNGRADILWHNSSTGQVFAILSGGTGVLATGFIYTEPNTQWQIAGVGDLSGSGKSNQLVWQNQGTGHVYLMTVQFEAGAFTQTGSMIYREPNLQWSILAVADFTGDGKGDLLWRNEVTGQVHVMAMNGGTITSQATVYTEPNLAWKVVSNGDYNGDGKADLLWRNESTGQVHIMLMNGFTIASQATVHTEPSTAWKLMGPYQYGL